MTSLQIIAHLSLKLNNKSPINSGRQLASAGRQVGRRDAEGRQNSGEMKADVDELQQQ